MLRGFTCGAFDLLHPGHLHLFETAKRRCEYLVVGLHTDPSLERPVIKNRPIQTTFERWAQLSAVKYVDEVIPYDTEADLCNLFATLDIQIRFLGSDYLSSEDLPLDVTGQAVCAQRQITIIHIPRLHTFSSTDIRSRIQMLCDKPSSSTATV